MKRLVLASGLLALTLAACDSPARTSTGTLGLASLPVTTASAAPAVHGSALETLAVLTVKGRAPMTGYSRAVFGPAWQDVDHNGCDTRNDILARDLTAKLMAGSCTVLAGILHDPYTAKTIVFHRGPGTSTKVQIDHVVALGDAWQMGAQRFSAATRLAFANDPLELLAVDGPTNLRKGDSDAASWLPPNKAFRCQYVSRQISVKARYGLAVTSAEKAAMARVLAACPSQMLPAASPITALVQTVPVSRPTTRPTPTPTSVAKPPPSHLPVVHPGAFCSPPGARGVTSRGTPMVCKLDSKGLRYRWGHA